MTTEVAELTLNEWITELYERHEGNWDAALDELMETAYTMPGFIMEWAKPLIISAVRERAMQYFHQRRARAFNWGNSAKEHVPTCPKGVSGEDMCSDTEAQLSAKVGLLMTYWLNNSGKFLSDACKPDLAIEIEVHEKNVIWNEKRREWYRSISQQLPDDVTTVSDVLDEEDLEELLAKAHKRVDAKWRRKKGGE
jgi:hypothetical protein